MNDRGKRICELHYSACLYEGLRQDLELRRGRRNGDSRRYGYHTVRWVLRSNLFQHNRLPPFPY